jgi:hypothetical protein
MDATHPPTSTLHNPTSVGQLFDFGKVTFGSCFLKTLKYHKNLWLQFFEKYWNIKKSLLVNSDFLWKIQKKEPSVLPKKLLCVFSFGKMSPFRPKQLGKIWTFKSVIFCQFLTSQN